MSETPKTLDQIREDVRLWLKSKFPTQSIPTWSTAEATDVIQGYEDAERFEDGSYHLKLDESPLDRIIFGDNHAGNILSGSGNDMIAAGLTVMKDPAYVYGSWKCAITGFCGEQSGWWDNGAEGTYMKSWYWGMQANDPDLASWFLATQKDESGPIRRSLTHYIDGGAGNDTIYGGESWDTLIGGTGNDFLDGMDGRDLVSYSAAESAVNVNLETGLATDGLGGQDTLVRIEDIISSRFADTLTGNGEDNRFFIQGGEGKLINGGEGSDTVYYKWNKYTPDSNESHDGHRYEEQALDIISYDPVTGILKRYDQDLGRIVEDTMVGVEVVETPNDTFRLTPETMEAGAGAEHHVGSFSPGDVVDYTNSTAGIHVNLTTGTGQGYQRCFCTP